MAFRCRVVNVNVVTLSCLFETRGFSCASDARDHHVITSLTFAAGPSVPSCPTRVENCEQMFEKAQPARNNTTKGRRVRFAMFHLSCFKTSSKGTADLFLCSEVPDSQPLPVCMCRRICLFVEARRTGNRRFVVITKHHARAKRTAILMSLLDETQESQIAVVERRMQL